LFIYVLLLEIPVSRPEGRRKRGRPKTTWRRTIDNEIKERGYTWGTLERKANNREVWRKGLRFLSVMLQHSEPYRSTDST
jgi:hypothetical protein